MVQLYQHLLNLAFARADMFAQTVACCAAAACRALQYDPTNRYAAYGIFSGMGIMALSLLLLGLL
jgi:hypothetical protein